MFEKEYAGICAICFEPVKNGQEYRYREKGRTFHLDCVKRWPQSYYAKIERKKAEKEQGEVVEPETVERFRQAYWKERE